MEFNYILKVDHFLKNWIVKGNDDKVFAIFNPFQESSKIKSDTLLFKDAERFR